jgi:hypothetical protein
VDRRRLRPAPVPASAWSPWPRWPDAGRAQAADKTRVYVVVVDGLNVEERGADAVRVLARAPPAPSTRRARAVMVAETTPNHVAMVTGAYPDKNGIVANDFPGVQGSGPDAAIGDGSEAVGRRRPALPRGRLAVHPGGAAVPRAHHRRGHRQGLPVHRHGARPGRRRPARRRQQLRQRRRPDFIPGVGITPDERNIAEATRVVQELDPDFLFVNLGSVDRTGHVDLVGGLTTPTGSRPVVRDVQRTATDTYLRAFFAALEQQGKLDSTRVLITADHSMDWSLPTNGVTVADNPDLADVIGEFVIAQNGGASLFSLRDRTRPDGPALLKRLRDSAIATDGVDEALYRQPNPADGGEQHWVGRVHPDWHQTGPRSGDLILTVDDGRRSTEPSSTSNPIPGNHGMPSTLRIPTIVTGGADAGIVRRTVPGSDDPDVRAADQAENVDMAPTAAWLLGVQPPTTGFDGRALTEAFSSRPEPACVQAAGAGPGTQVPGPGAAPGTQPDAAPPASAAPTRRLPATGPAVLLPLAGLGLAGAVAVAVRRRSSAQPRA